MQLVSVNSAMRIAMAKAAAQSNAAVATIIRPAVQCGVGKKSVPSWNAHLSFKTAKALQKQGILF